MITRADLKPGQVFRLPGLKEHWGHTGEPLVVVDDKSEVGLWTGDKTVVGDIGPGLLVDVLL